jgi:hypothetical protein
MITGLHGSSADRNLLTDLKKSIFLHIGTHKTGTKSLQEYLHRHRQALHAADFAFYDGMFDPQNHAELHCAAMRSGRDSPFRQYYGITDIEQLRRETESRISAFVRQTPQRKLIFSAEGLAFLRHADEIRYLAGLLAPERTTVIVYLRDKAAFLRSYRRQLLRMKLTLSSDPESCAYCENDSWLTDFDALIGAYAGSFSEIRVLQHDQIMATEGTIIPAFLDEIGLRNYDAAGTKIFLNLTPPSAC